MLPALGWACQGGCVRCSVQVRWCTFARKVWAAKSRAGGGESGERRRVFAVFQASVYERWFQSEREIIMSRRSNAKPKEKPKSKSKKQEGTKNEGQ